MTNNLPEDPVIFLVDDQKITNFINKKLIEKSKIKVKIMDFINPINALKDFSKFEPSHILLDLNMPQLDGWQFLEEMKKNEFYSKVIIVTSSDSPIDRERAKEYDLVIDYKTKPLSEEVMRSIFE
ncbi:response regulator [Mesonia maritima]|uniref:CheY-like chemotaxis protein n=1 Tax=Mesonia maritima TaxID=1793873 RepID=A0ABU1K5W7_9FLAO|nr:response regulator [Mesonia maritima]MDR6301001.1 CheY-like chemotaxis protein [Mesonia maritima]